MGDKEKGLLLVYGEVFIGLGTIALFPQLTGDRLTAGIILCLGILLVIIAASNSNDSENSA